MIFDSLSLNIRYLTTHFLKRADTFVLCKCVEKGLSPWSDIELANSGINLPTSRLDRSDV